MYRKLRAKGVIGDNDISIQFNVDGVELQKSSKKSLWPLIVGVNELPPRLRRNNPLLCAVWYAEKKPNMNMFLEPFVEEMIDLYANGFESTTYGSKEKIKIKVHTLFCTTDSVARPCRQNMKQYNGRYGCAYCLHEGETVAVGKGHARVYRGDKAKSRTKRTHTIYAELAILIQKVIKGVKGPSILSRLPNFDIIIMFVPDYMHSLLLGICKLIVCSWINPKNHEESFYIGGEKKEEFDRRMKSMKPPSELTRTPRVVHANYKANEWKNFLLYYSFPCLKGLLPERYLKRYLKHWQLFIFGTSIYSKDEISSTELEMAKTALKKFVEDIEPVYGKELMRYNVHLLLHIPKVVENFGALWAWSAFMYESFNGVLKTLFHGTQYVPLQICKFFNRLRYLKNHSEIFAEETCSERARELFISLMKQCNVKRCIEYGENLRVFGKGRKKKLNGIEKIVIRRIADGIFSDECAFYDRFVYKNVLFHSTSYKRLKKRINSVISTTDCQILMVSHLLKIENVGYEEFIVLGELLEIMNEKIFHSTITDSSLFSYVVRKTNTVVCCKVVNILRKCAFVPYINEKICIIPVVNKMETD